MHGTTIKIIVNLNFSLFDTYIQVFWGGRIIHGMAVEINCHGDLYSLQHKS